MTSGKILIGLVAAMMVLVIYWMFHSKPLLCMACGMPGYSDEISEAKDRQTYVKEYSSFEIITDSLKYLSLNNKTFFIEKKFRYHLTTVDKIEIGPDSLGNQYQLGMSPRSGRIFKSQHNLYLKGNFSEIPDTVHGHIWSYSVKWREDKRDRASTHLLEFNFRPVHNTSQKTSNFLSNISVNLNR